MRGAISSVRHRVDDAIDECRLERRLDVVAKMLHQVSLQLVAVVAVHENTSRDGNSCRTLLELDNNETLHTTNDAISDVDRQTNTFFPFWKCPELGSTQIAPDRNLEISAAFVG